MPTYTKFPRPELSYALDMQHVKIETELLADTRRAYYVNGNFVGCLESPTVKDKYGNTDFASFLDEETEFLRDFMPYNFSI